MTQFNPSTFYLSVCTKPGRCLSCICVSGIDRASFYDLLCALQLFRQSCAFYYDNPHLH